MSPLELNSFITIILYIGHINGGRMINFFDLKAVCNQAYKINPALPCPGISGKHYYRELLSSISILEEDGVIRSHTKQGKWITHITFTIKGVESLKIFQFTDDFKQLELPNAVFHNENIQSGAQAG